MIWEIDERNVGVTNEEVLVIIVVRRETRHRW